MAEPTAPPVSGRETAQALRRMNEEMGDIEFEMSMAPYNNYTGGTPADKAKFEGLYPGAGEQTLRGQYTPPHMTPEKIKKERVRYYDSAAGRSGYLYGIPGKVQGIAGGAVPKVWQHEFNHMNNPNRREGTIREIDAIIAPNKRAWDDAVRMQRDWSNRRRKPENKISLEDAEKRLLNRMQQLHPRHGPWSTAQSLYKNEMERGGNVPESMRTKNWFMPYSEMDHLKDYSKMRQKQTYWSKALREMQDE